MRMPWTMKLTGVALPLLGALACASLAAGCDDGGSWPAAWATLEEEVLVEVNARRAEGATCGGESFGPAPALEMHPALRRAARDHSQDMAEQGYFDHTSLDGRRPSDRFEAAGYVDLRGWGENIAGGQSDAASVMQSWMNSSGHCSNIMNPSFRNFGIGYFYLEGSDWGHYWTQGFASE